MQEKRRGGGKWHGFEVLELDRAILRGSRSTEDRRFKPTSRGRQASAASVVALVYAQLLQVERWTEALVDRVLEYGDRLFRASQLRARLSSDEYMSSELLLNEFFVEDYKCRVCMESGLVFGNLRSEAVGAPCLLDGLKLFFAREPPPNFGVLTCQGRSVAIWRRSAAEELFYFDPAPADEWGRASKTGQACVLRLGDVHGLLELFLSRLEQQYDSRYCIDRLSLIKVKAIERPKSQCRSSPQRQGGALVVEAKLLEAVSPLEPEDEAAARLDCSARPSRGRSRGGPPRRAPPLVEELALNIELTNSEVQERLGARASLADRSILDERYSYEEVKVNVPSSFIPLPAEPDPLTGSAGTPDAACWPGAVILHGWTHDASPPYKAKGAQSVANCLVAFGMKRLHPVGSWLRQSLDQVLAAGDELFGQLRAAKPALKTVTAADFDGLKFQIEGRKMMIDVDVLTVVGAVVSKEPGLLGLRAGLEEFLAKNPEGVLESSTGSPLGIWTQDDSFYLFDSRACDMFGMHEPDPKKGKKKKKEEEGAGPRERRPAGKCCVIRFPKLASLYGHLAKSLEPSEPSERFTIRRVEILDDVPGIRAWNCFKPAVLGKSWILRGSMSSEDDSFEDYSRGVQGLAMPVLALVSARSIPPKDWDRRTVDEVLREGDDYYNWCIPPQPGEEAPVDDKSLNLASLKKVLYYKKCKALIEIEESCVVGDLSEPSLEPAEASAPAALCTIEQGVRDFFETRELALLEASDKFFAAWKSEDDELPDKSKEVGYYLFHDKPEGEVACVLRFLDRDELALTLKELLGEAARTAVREGGSEAASGFFIHALKLASVSKPMSDEEIEADKAVPIKPELKNYSALGQTGAVLLGLLAQNNESFFGKETRDKQQAANALLALATTKLFHAYNWHPQVIDDILRMADRLTAENAKNIGDSQYEEEPSAPSDRDYLLPSEIDRSFFIGVNEISVAIDEELVAGKVGDLEQVLRDFFGVHRMAVFRCGQIILPVWTDENVVFTMNPRAGKESGNAAGVYYWYSGTALASLADFLVKLLEPTAEQFSLDGISLENRCTESQRPPQDLVTEQRWYNFHRVSPGSWKIDCSLSLADDVFYEENRGKQRAAVCVIAIVFSKINQPRHWSTEILDEIMITGDKLHSQSAIRLGENRAFQPNEIISEFFLSNRRIDLKIQDCKQAGTLLGKGPKIQSLRDGLWKFFEQSIAGCVSLAQSANMAIWFCENCFYSFTPGLFLMRFEQMDLLSDHILQLGEAETDFEITSLTIVDSNKLPPWKFDPSPGVRPSNLPPLNAYSQLPGRARAILRGFTHQASDIFGEGIRGRQTAANCIVCLAMAVIKNPVSWTRKTLDEILTIGFNVHRESQKYSRRTARTTLRAKDIVRIFYIGVNVLAVDVEEELCGIVANPPPEPPAKGKGKGKGKPAAKDKGKKAKSKRTPPPPPILLEQGLDEFFRRNNAGILVSGQFMVAVWRDNGVYFMYDPKARDEQGRRGNEEIVVGPGRGQGEASCVVWYACLEPLYELMFGNMSEEERYGKFAMSRVVVRTVIVEPLPAPAGYSAVKQPKGAKPAEDCPMPPIRLEQELLEQSAPELNVDLESFFRRVDRQLSVMLASSHMASPNLPPENRGYQSTAIAAVAIVLSNLHAPSTWTRPLLDAVLKYGDVLHTECARLARPGSRNLVPGELLDVFVLGDVRARVRLRENLVAGISLEHDLTSALGLFFDSHRSAILHTANYALAVVQHWARFYVFDPSDRNGFSDDPFHGLACLLKCESLQTLAKLLLRLFAFNEPAVYSLSDLQVLDLHFFLT